MNKKLSIVLIILIFQIGYSQQKKGNPFFITSLSTTFAINEEYTIQNDDQPFLIPSSFLLRAGFGYEINRRWAASLHAGFDHHFNFGINAIPTYGSLRYNITEDDGNAFFIESSYGKMWRPSVKFEDGNYYKIGIGGVTINDDGNKIFIRLDFHRKKIVGFKNGNLDSLSLGIGIMLF
jgi:hypothetical protein